MFARLFTWLRTRRVKRTRTWLRVNAHQSRWRVTEMRDGGLDRHWRESGQR